MLPPLRGPGYAEQAHGLRQLQRHLLGARGAWNFGVFDLLVVVVVSRGASCVRFYGLLSRLATLSTFAWTDRRGHDGDGRHHIHLHTK